MNETGAEMPTEPQPDAGGTQPDAGGDRSESAPDQKRTRRIARLREAYQLAKRGELTEEKAREAVGLPVEVFDRFQAMNASLNETDDEGRLTSEAKDAIVAEGMKLDPPMDTKHLDLFIDAVHPDLNPEDKQEVLDKLKIKELAKESADDEFQEAQEARLTQEEVDDLAAQLEEENRDLRAKFSLSQRLKDSAQIKVIDPVLQKMEHWQHKFDHWLHPEDPLKTWTKRGGKMVLNILKYLAYLILIECNAINKMTRKQR